MPEEIEYLCGKALAQEMPISLQGLSVDKPCNARQDEYLSLIGRYERLRLEGKVPDSVKRKLREPGEEFHLVEGPGGRSQFFPVRYLSHKVTGPEKARWKIVNPYQLQPLRARIEALYSVSPYEGDGLTLADFKEEEFTVHRDAPGVEHSLKPSTEVVKAGELSGRLWARSRRKQREGAWALAGKVFSPPLDMRNFEAMGVWVYGDEKGEVLNFQLRSLPQYWPVYAEHYVKVDFRGWRYFELPLRERDAAEYVNYKWPYHDIYAIFRSPLILHAVSELNIYLNNIPPEEEITCYIGPVRALKALKAKLQNLALTVNGRKVLFPVELESGQYIEFEPPSECRLYSERGELLRRFELQGEVPFVKEGENQVSLFCKGPKGLRARVEVTIIVWGEPFDAERRR